MKKCVRNFLLLVLVGVFWRSGSASADEAGGGASAAPETPVKKATKGGKRTREKEADGSEAPDRFQADTVIKSQYKLHGQPLEVDPD